MAMKLNPVRPPGRSSRKALEYEAEIRRLRAMGYSFEAIRLALAEVGIQVSRGTVRREATRPLSDASSTPVAADAKPSINPDKPSAAQPVQSMGVVDEPASRPAASSKDLAEAYFSQHISNPLLRRKRS